MSNTDYPDSNHYYNNNIFVEVQIKISYFVHKISNSCLRTRQWFFATNDAWKYDFQIPSTQCWRGTWWYMQNKQVKQNTYSSTPLFGKKNTFARGRGWRDCWASGASFILLSWSKYSNLWPSSQIWFHPDLQRSLSSHTCSHTMSGSCFIYPEAPLLSCLRFFRKVEGERKHMSFQSMAGSNQSGFLTLAELPVELPFIHRAEWKRFEGVMRLMRPTSIAWQQVCQHVSGTEGKNRDRRACQTIRVLGSQCCYNILWLCVNMGPLRFETYSVRSLEVDFHSGQLRL